MIPTHDSFDERIRLSWPVRVTRVLIPGWRLKALLKQLQSPEASFGQLMSIEVLSEPRFKRSMIPTVHLMQLKLRVVLRETSTVVVYAFPSTQKPVENLMELEEFVTPSERSERPQDEDL